MNAVLAVAFPVFAVIAAGFAAGRFAIANADDSAALNRFVFRFAMPAALFGLMSGASGLRVADAVLAVSYGLPAMAALFIAFHVARRLFGLSRAEAGAHAFASAMGNAVFLGLPIALAIEGWARPFVVLMLVEGIVTLGVGAALMAAPTDARKTGWVEGLGEAALRPLKNPLVAAALAGFATATIGVDLPNPVRAFFSILGDAAGPAALFSLGLFLAKREPQPLSPVAGRVASIALVKMALLPAATLSILYALGFPDRDYAAAAALFTATPTAIGAFIMASQYGSYIREIATAIAATTALSVFTISAVLVMFG